VKKKIGIGIYRFAFIVLNPLLRAGIMETELRTKTCSTLLALKAAHANEKLQKGWREGKKDKSMAERFGVSNA
jgi:hypothetical protein